MVYSYNEILCSELWAHDKNIKEPWKYYAKCKLDVWKKSV